MARTRTAVLGTAGAVAGVVAGVVAVAVLASAVGDDVGGAGAPEGFGGDGVTSVQPGPGHARARAVAVDGQGRTVLAGPVSRAFGAARLDRDGRLDPSFGDGGTVVTAVGETASASAVVVQPDGRVVVAGESTAAGDPLDSDLALVRYDADGALDPTFGDGGVVTTSLVGPVRAAGLALQPDGRLVLAGTVETSADAFDSDVAVVRYLPDGRPDPSFGDGGVVVTDVSGGGPDVAGAVAVDGAGRVVVAGASGQPVRSEPATSTWTLLRYGPDGRLDPAYGDGGVARSDVSPAGEVLTSVAALPDGRVLVAGQVDLDGTMPQVALGRFTATGRPDPAFGGGDGTVLTAAARLSEGDAVVAVEDGGAVVVGRAADDALDSDPDWQWLVARYDAAGELVPGFGDGGLVRLPYGEVADAVALLPDGDLLVAGCDCPLPAFARGDQESASAFVVARLDGSGRPRG